MRIAWLTTAGFLLPTAIVVMTLHLAGKAGAGEALDGALSSLWFAALFLVGSLAGLRLAAPERRRPGALRRVLGGLAAGVFVWSLLGALWALLPSESVRVRAFAVNSAVVLVAGLAATVARPIRGPVQGKT